MRLLMTRSVNITWNIITTHLTLSRLCRLLLVRMDVYIVTLSDFYSYRIIGKLTDFLHLQEFSQRNQTWGLTVFFHLQEFNLQNPPAVYSTSTVFFVYY